jgi:hypothetical protein
MNGTAAGFARFGAALVGLVALGSLLAGQATAPEEQGFPTDWSHRHVVFSRPATGRRAARVEGDPRLWQQWARGHIARIVSNDGSAPVEDSFSVTSAIKASGARMHRDWSENLGSSATVGAGNFPAKYAFKTSTANCATAATPDFVVFTTGVQGTPSQPTVMAFDNLYSGCTGTKPLIYWSFNTGGQVLTSPVISGDGTQVAFVQTNLGLLGTLVLLKWKAGSGTLATPTTLAAVSNAAYRACTAPCQSTKNFIKK